MADAAIQEWEGGHFHDHGSMVLIGPRYRYQIGDRVRIPDGRVVRVTDYDNKIPDTPQIGPALRANLRMVDGFLVDGIMRAEVEFDG